MQSHTIYNITEIIISQYEREYEEIEALLIVVIVITENSEQHRSDAVNSNDIKRAEIFELLPY